MARPGTIQNIIDAFTAPESMQNAEYVQALKLYNFYNSLADPRLHVKNIMAVQANASTTAAEVLPFNNLRMQGVGEDIPLNLYFDRAGTGDPINMENVGLAFYTILKAPNRVTAYLQLVQAVIPGISREDALAILMQQPSVSAAIDGVLNQAFS